jgi:hypothetical protein
MFNKNDKKSEVTESREDRFKRIASRRVQETLGKLRLLGNCSDRANYSYDAEQVRKIFSTIDNELKRIRALYNKSKSKEKFEL